MEGQKSSNLHYEELVPKPRHKLSRRRSSIGAGTALEVTPENHAIERSTCYNDFAEFTNVAKRSFRRNSLTGATTTDERELKLRHSLAFQKDYPGQSQNIQKLKERFQRRGSLMGNSSGIRSGTKTQSQPSDEEPSMDWTGFSPGGRESMSMPLTEVHQTIQSTRKEDLERKHLIESLVHFSCHIPSAVLEDLISHELDLRKNRNSDEKYSDDDKSDGSLSSLSDDEDKDDNRIDKSDHMAQSRISIEDRLFLTSPSLPRSRERESALLFVDISGFTTLSTLLEVEFLSKVINSYFEMIVEEVISYGGDILKFAGDAFFAEWRIGEENQHLNSKDLDDASSGLMRLNVSLSSSQHFSYRPSVPVEMATADCVLQATKCAASIVTKFSDYLVSIAGDSSLKNDMNGPNEAMLNVHCGIGVGRMVCLHVGDYREDYDDGQDDNAVELRREFLFLGDPINQVSPRLSHRSLRCFIVSH